MVTENEAATGAGNYGEALSTGALATFVFVQMLPATLLVPVIRPYFAAYYAGNESAMHAFMSVNMVGAVLIAPFVGWLVDRYCRVQRIFCVLVVTDALLLVGISCDVSLSLLLVLRTLEGAMHVGAATVLLAYAARLSHARGNGRTMGAMGAGIMFAVAFGSSIGAVAMKVHLLAPLWLGAGILVACAVYMGGCRGRFPELGRTDRARLGILSALRKYRTLIVPATAAFVGRFTVGLLVVTFALFVYAEHGLDDSAVGFLFTLLTLSFALAMYPMARVSEATTRASIMGGGASLYAGCLLVLGYVEVSLLPVVMVVAGVASAMLFSTSLCYAAKIAEPETRGTAMASVNTAGCLGMLLGPAAAGILSVTLKSSISQVAVYQTIFVIAGSCVGLWAVLVAPWLVERFVEEREQSRTKRSQLG